MNFGGTQLSPYWMGSDGLLVFLLALYSLLLHTVDHLLLPVTLLSLGCGDLCYSSLSPLLLLVPWCPGSAGLEPWLASLFLESLLSIFSAFSSIAQSPVAKGSFSQA